MDLTIVQLGASVSILALVVARGVRERLAGGSRNNGASSLDVLYYGLLASSLGLVALSVFQFRESAAPPTATLPSLGYPISPHSEATFSTLLGQDAEMHGYGLYSYLLFGAEPSDDTTRERFLAALISISSLPSTRKMRLYKFDRETLNVTYVPLAKSVEINSRPTDRATALALLKAYNYPRARALIDKVNPALRNGPYIISVLDPLTEAKNVPTRYLFQDLSSVTPKVVTSWVTIFQSEAAKEEFWEPETASRFAADLRSVVDVVAHQIMPSMPSKIATLIGWEEAPADKKP